MKLLKYHILLLLLLSFALACEDQLSYDSEETTPVLDSNLPCYSPPAVVVPEEPAYQHGETVRLWWFVRFGANLESDLRSNLNCPNIQWSYILLKDGVFFRALENLPEYTGPTASIITVDRYWHIPNDIPSGSGYQILYTRFDACGNIDLNCTAPSHVFSILPSECTIGEPEVLESSYDLGTSLIYNVPTYSYDNERTFTVKIYKGSVL